MLNLTNSISLSEEQKRIISSFGTLQKEHWDRNQTKLRKKITSDLKGLQDNVCVYCGCEILDTPDVEHIAHKAEYPQFLFTPKNLALSCKTCNQMYKGDTNIIETLDTDYLKCKFLMVHPYIDDVNYYFDTSKVIIMKKVGLTPAENERADFTIKILHWDEEAVRNRRCREAAAAKYFTEHVTTRDQELIKNTLQFRP